MKLSLLLLPFLFLLAGCGRTYTLIGRIVFLEASQASSITEIVGKAFPQVGGEAVPNASVTLFHELKDNLPVRDSTWQRTIEADSKGQFELSDYATPGEKNLVGLEVSAPGYETVFTTYIDYIDPDEQFFLIVLRKAG